MGPLSCLDREGGEYRSLQTWEVGKYRGFCRPREQQYTIYRSTWNLAWKIIQWVHSRWAEIAKLPVLQLLGHSYVFQLQPQTIEDNVRAGDAASRRITININKCISKPCTLYHERWQLFHEPWCIWRLPDAQPTGSRESLHSSRLSHFSCFCQFFQSLSVKTHLTVAVGNQEVLPIKIDNNEFNIYRSLKRPGEAFDHVCVCLSRQ